MDYLQYEKDYLEKQNPETDCFKPYYKWITFNTLELKNL